MDSYISVIVPIYNVSKYLNKCISGISAQTYRNLQIILVNDGSTDGSAEICDRFAAEDDRIMVIHKENGGLVSARKAGLRVATGEYVTYVDGDDWIEPDMYEQMIWEMADNDVDIVETDAFMDIGNESVFMKSKITYGKYEADKIIPIMLCDEKHNECRLKPHVWSKLFRRKQLEKVQFAVDESISVGEDAAVTYPYMLCCNKISVLDYAGYHYVQHGNSMLRTSKELELYKSKILLQGLEKVFQKDVRRDVLVPQLNQYAKLIFLNKHIAFFDKDEEYRLLMPYGGIAIGCKVIVYGAGNVGQSIYRYLKKSKGVEVVAWLDREYDKYQKLGMNVDTPDTISEFRNDYDKIIIAVNSSAVAESIVAFLEDSEVETEKILWFTNEFLQLDILDYL